MQRIGVVGAGTMGAGIAQLAAQSGARTVLYDPVDGALERGRRTIETGWERMLAKGRMSEAERSGARERLTLDDDIGALAGCELVVEAAPESLELKRELFASVAAVVGDEAVLATNTSSLSVTEIAAGVPVPERVVGLHFFNPAPVMRLVEVVAGARSSERALAVARAAGEAMGRHVVAAADVAGFLVNRANRPFALESLKLLEERIAEPEVIDRVLRLGAGFRMGPFELMDLVGIDVNHAVAESFQRASYGEPRWRPSPLAARKVAAGTLGRKTGEGWYRYPPGRPPDPEAPERGGGDGRVVRIVGHTAFEAVARVAGFVVDDAREPWLVVAFTPPEPTDAPTARLLSDGSLQALDPQAVGFHVLDDPGIFEVTSTLRTRQEASTRFEAFVAAIGLRTETVADAPGLITGRVVCQLINEACFLVGEGHGSAADLDAAMPLALGHPCGPFERLHRLGPQRVVATLDALHRELGEERYRVAPLLRRLALA